MKLNVISINLPSLRERRDDIPLLAEYFIKIFNKKYNLECSPRIPRDVMKIFLHYNWPGNIRELYTTLEGMCVLYDGKRFTTNDLPEIIKKSFIDPVKNISPGNMPLPDDGIDLKKLLFETEKHYYKLSLIKGKKFTEAARYLNIKPHSFRARAKTLELS